jgi:cell division septation protein DedD
MISLFGCTTLHQETDEQKQVYIFDEVPEEKTIEAPKTGEYPDIKETYFVVQVGAYTSEEKANSFAEMSRNKTNYKFSVVFSENLNLYLVQVIPFFKSRTEAEEVRNNLWKVTEFVDAWILTINK